MMHWDRVALYRLQYHILKGGVDSVEVWLKGEGNMTHQLLEMNLTLKENMCNKTITEFPHLHVLSKGAGPLKCAQKSGEEHRSGEESKSSDEQMAGEEHKSGREHQSGEEECNGSTNLITSESLRLIATTYSDSDD
jgi:hypothetical protein